MSICHVRAALEVFIGSHFQGTRSHVISFAQYCLHLCLSHFLPRSPPTLHALPKLLMTDPFGFFIHSSCGPSYILPILVETTSQSVSTKYFPSIESTQKIHVVKNNPLLKFMGICRKQETICTVPCV